LSPADRAALTGQLDALQARPRFVFFLLGPIEPRALERTFASLDEQAYPDWELVLKSGEKLPNLPDLKGRLRVLTHPIRLPPNSFVGTIRAGDTMPPQALGVFALECSSGEAEVVYSDEDVINSEGHRDSPCFKTDWNPDLFAHRNYLGSMTVIRSDLLPAPVHVDSVTEWEALINRAIGQRTPSPQTIRHLPFILYHCAHRAIPPPSANRTVRNDGPIVSIVIPSRDNGAVLKRCIESIRLKTTYQTYRIVVVDNGSVEPEACEFLKLLERTGAAQIVRDDRPFNFSSLCNLGARCAQGELILFLNNDVEVITPSWLSFLVQAVSRSGVGAAGACLWYPDHTLQHGGVTLGLGGIAGHFGRGLIRRGEERWGRTAEPSTVSAVTGACMIVPRDLFERCGGFDEQHLPIAYNDVDLCLRFKELGFRTAYEPRAELYHYESASRTSDFASPRRERYREEVAFMRDRWGALLEQDPFFSPNLALENGIRRLSRPPRIKAPWQLAS
jgi:GT2 family glycosyltransferase